MAIDLTLTPAAAAKSDDSLGIDRAFVLSMARVPVLAALWVVAASGGLHCQLAHASARERQCVPGGFRVWQPQHPPRPL